MRIWLDLCAREEIEREAFSRRLLETGGPLFGYAVGDEVVVVGAGGPGSCARHSRRGFEPFPPSVQQAIATVHEASEGRYRFLGSWHSHPFSRPVPSGADQLAAAETAAQADVCLPAPLILIQSVWLRRVLFDSDLRGYRWDSGAKGLRMASIRIVTPKTCTYPQVEVHWAGVVP